MTRKKTEAAAQAAEVPEAEGPQRYRARVYHEIEDGDGVKRVEPGSIVVSDGDEITVYPPEAFAEAYPDLVEQPIDDQPEE